MSRRVEVRIGVWMSRPPLFWNPLEDSRDARIRALAARLPPFDPSRPLDFQMVPVQFPPGVDLQPRRLSNYLRSGYLQVQLISSVILFQFRGDNGVSRDDLYDSITDVFPAVTFANFRKVLATGVDSEIFIREKDPSDSRRTLYRISEEMMEPLTNYFSSVVSDFDQLFSGVFDGALRKEDIDNLQEYIVKRMTITPFKG